jgi:hypothetical protein
LAAEAAADPDRILPEENPATTKPAEARRWVRTYAQLLAWKKRVLQVAHEKLGEVSEDPAREEIVKTDLVLLDAENDRLKKRLHFWKRRQEKLGN